MRILTGFEMPGRTQAPRTPGPLFEPARWEKKARVGEVVPTVGVRSHDGHSSYSEDVEYVCRAHR